MASLVFRPEFSRFNVLGSLFRPSYNSFRYYSRATRPKPETFLFRPDKVEIIDDVEKNVAENKFYRFRHHPGSMDLGVQRIPSDVQKAIGRILVKGDSASVHKDRGKEIERHMQNRRLPFEAHDYRRLQFDIERRLIKSESKKGRSPEACPTNDERSKYEEWFKNEVERRLRGSVYNWKAMNYDSPSKCMTYCIMRFAPEYAALRRIFHEIATRLPDFKPKHVLDFGSGVGTTHFACEATWPQSTEEYLCSEISSDMHDFMRLLLRDGEPENEPRHQNITFREFLPPSSERQFDIVVSAYSLFELPSYDERMRTLTNLWLKTNQFLVLVERGTNAGYRAIIEARDFVLAGAHEIYRHGLSDVGVDKEAVEQILKTKGATESQKFLLLREKFPDVEFPTMLPHGHVFAPCPHDMGCPRLMDVTPCNFSAQYFPLRLSRGEEVPEQEIFSFIVLRKGYAPASKDRWPRIVREPRKSGPCVWCQTCTPLGVLEDKAFNRGTRSTERGKLYRFSKFSSWGDMLPFVSTYEEKSASDAESTSAAQEERMDDEDDWEDDEDEDETENNDEMVSKVVKNSKDDGT